MAKSEHHGLPTVEDMASELLAGFLYMLANIFDNRG